MDNSGTLTYFELENPLPGLIEVEFDRGSAANSFNLKAIDEFQKVTQILDKEARVVIFRTKPSQAFLSGGDLKEFFEKLTRKEEALAMALKMQSVLENLERGSFISLAAASSGAFGGGAEILLAFDRVFAGPNFSLSFKQIHFSLCPGWGGATRLIEKIGYHKALDVIVRGEILNAGQALSKGLVEEIAENPLEKARDYAKILLEKDPNAIRAIKHFFAEQRYTDYSGRFFKENIAFRTLWGEKPHLDRVSQFLNRKK